MAVQVLGAAEQSYLQNLSVLFDCAIVLRTVRIVLFGQGAR
jgi:lipopolysaccharide/colanic/teichoic acid biosynthesis glycosyltransferase